MRVPSSRCSTMPMDEASMAQAARPASAYSRNARCSRTGSGVVMPVDSMAGGMPTPSVPTRAQPLRSCSFTWASACASHQAVVVLPLVPVTARSEEHTSELQSPCNLVCRLLLEKKKKKLQPIFTIHNHHSMPPAHPPTLGLPTPAL